MQTGTAGEEEQEQEQVQVLATASHPVVHPKEGENSRSSTTCGMSMFHFLAITVLASGRSRQSMAVAGEPTDTAANGARHKTVLR